MTGQTVTSTWLKIEQIRMLTTTKEVMQSYELNYP
jgi:hypothetical protein